MNRFSRLLLTGLLLLPASQAFAHATPTTYEPAASSILQTAPDKITIRFSERVEPGASAIDIFAPDGTKANGGEAAVDPSDAHVYATGLKKSGSGTYTVSWKVTSADDGHFSSGAFSFSVGVATDTGSQAGIQVVHRTTLPQGFAIFLELLGQALFAGSVAVFLLLSVTTVHDENGRRLLHRRLRTAMIAGFVLIALGTLLYITLESSSLAGNLRLDFATGVRTFCRTLAGSYSLYRLAVSAVFLVCFFCIHGRLQRHPFDRPALALLAIIWAILLLLRARVSHAAASDFLPTVSILINAIHLGGKELWIGGVIGTVLMALPLLEKKKDARQTARLLTAVSAFLAVMLLIGGVTGVYIIWLHLKSFANVFTTQWGTTFFTLGGITFLFLGVRLYQQCVIEPSLVRLSRGTGKEEDRLTAQPSAMVLTIELWTGLAVLLTSSMLIITSPPVHQEPLLLLTAESQGAALSLGAHPYEQDQMQLVLEPKTGTAISDAIVTLTNTDENIGPLPVTLEKRFNGGYVFPRSLFSPPGHWTVDVTAHQSAGYDAVASFKISYPADLLPPASPLPGDFDWVMIVTALIVLGLAVVLYRYSRRLYRSVPASSSGSFSTGFTGPSLAAVSLGCVILLPLFLTQVIGHVHGGFSALCQQKGGMWHESVPMREGRVTSPVAAIGCMVGAGRGQYHFADAREFAYFMRPASAIISLDRPGKITAGVPVTMTATVKDSSGNIVTDLNANHDRYLHAVIIGRDLDTFAHIHPDDIAPVTPEMARTGTFTIRPTFPQAGRYVLALDFTVRGQDFSQTFFINVEGSPQLGKADIAPTQTFTHKGYTVKLLTPETMVSGFPMRLRMLVDEDNQPLTDLQPYLASAMHIAVAKGDLLAFIHAHGELPQPWLDSLITPRDPKVKHWHGTGLPDQFGPQVDAYVTFPSPGTYVVFAQFKHLGKVQVARFVVEVQ